MAKKQHISRLDPPVFDVNKFAVTGDLPTAESVNQSVSDVTGVKAENPLEKKLETPKKERVGEKKVKESVNKPKSEISNPKSSTPSVKIKNADIERGRDARGALNRVGITALVDKDVLQQTKILAIQKGVSMSDLINDALVGYLSKKSN